MMKFFVFFLIFILGIVGFGAWFVYSATAFPFDDWQGTVQLQVENGLVYIKQGNLDYQIIKENVTLQEGDSVKTGENSFASIIVGEGTVIRLDANTELTISQAEISSLWEQQVKVKVGEGKIWFRILKLFNDQSQWEVETPTVVATVRGTAFSIGKEGLFVGESQVAVKSKRLNNSDEILVTLGEAMQFGSEERDTLQKMKLGHDKLDDKTKKWVDLNFKNDKDFQKSTREKIYARLKKYMGAEPGTFKYKLQKQAEQIREKFIDDAQTKAKWEDFKQQRRLAEGLWLAEKGDVKELQDFLKEQTLGQVLQEKILPELIDDDHLDWQQVMPDLKMPDRVFDWKQFDIHFQRLNHDLNNFDFYFDIDSLDVWLKYQTDNPEYFRLIKVYTDKWSNLDYTDPVQVQLMLNSPEYINLAKFFSQMIDDLQLPKRPLNINYNNIELKNGNSGNITDNANNETATNMINTESAENEEPIETLEDGQNQALEDQAPEQELIDDEEIILEFNF